MSFRRKPKDVKNIRKLFTLIHQKQQPEVVQPIKKRKFESNPPRDNFPQLGLIYDHIELMMADRDIITYYLINTSILLKLLFKSNTDNLPDSSS